MVPRPEPLSGSVDPHLEYFRPSSEADTPLTPRHLVDDVVEWKKKMGREEFLTFMRQERPLFGLRQLTVSRIFFVVNHILGAYGLYLLLRGEFSWGVLLFEFVYSYMGSLGTTIGAHRLWTHKSFKAKLPLKILLMIWQTITGHYSIYKWCLDHRIHHKYTDTNKDPHNAKRGFWFSHSLWTITPKHPELLEKLKTFDMPDLENDPVVLFQARWYIPLVTIFYGQLPVNIVWYFFGVRRFYAHCINSLRWCYNTHISSAVNSFAHIFGDKPYDENITSTDNSIVSLFAVGEGWHNYHHTFPWDYKASELGWKVNFSTMLIDFFAWIGWAYDMKVVSPKMLKQRVMKSGDGSHPLTDDLRRQHELEAEAAMATGGIQETEHSHVDSTATWGWGDEDVSDEFRKMTCVLKPKTT